METGDGRTKKMNKRMKQKTKKQHEIHHKSILCMYFINSNFVFSLCKFRNSHHIELPKRNKKKQRQRRKPGISALLYI